MVMEGDLTWRGEHKIQYTDDVLQNVHLKPVYFINQCHPVKFNTKEKRIQFFQRKKSYEIMRKTSERKESLCISCQNDSVVKNIYIVPIIKECKNQILI